MPDSRVLLLSLAVTLSGCGAALSGPPVAPDPIVTIDGPLTMTVSDAPATGGVLFVSAVVTGGAGRVTVRSTRYGSLCSTGVAGHADVSPGQITFKAIYSERLTVCTADIRSITYVGQLDGIAAGEYDVHVLHTNPDGTGGTVSTQYVTVSPRMP